MIYNTIKPIYKFDIDKYGERVRDEKGSGCFKVRWQVIGQAGSINDAKRQGVSTPVLEVAQ
ncbi:hypothetical protein [Undibacterium sp.]|uniref:hypothetical protein n=1 Tax=Undibacterium sp. TaxID=1914977 RepID=UPI00375091FD